MEHDYQLDWWALGGRDIPGWTPATHPAEVCVTPGHAEHTRGDAWTADTYPHFGALEITEAPAMAVAPGQMAAFA
jgi:hypothetical protein